MVLRGISEPKREEENEKLHNLFFLPDIIIVIKSRRMRSSAYLAHGGVEKCIQNFRHKI
jgi:hypothetical protein